MNLKYVSFGILLAGIGCTKVELVQPAKVIPSQKPASVWVRTSDGDITSVRQPRIDGDTLRGTDITGQPFASGLTDLVWVKARQKSPTKTALLLVGVAAFGSVAVYELINAGTKQVAQPCVGYAAQESGCQNPYYLDRTAY